MSPAPPARMIWLKSALVGIAAAMGTIVAVILAATTWHVNAGQGSGGIGVVSFGLTGMLIFPAALAFALGFRWMFRRQQRRLAK